MAESQIPIPVIIDTLEHTLKFLQANHTRLPIRQVQDERGEAIFVGSTILNDADADISREQFDRLYNIVLELDRVGY